MKVKVKEDEEIQFTPVKIEIVLESQKEVDMLVYGIDSLLKEADSEFSEVDLFSSTEEFLSAIRSIVLPYGKSDTPFEKKRKRM